MYFFNFIENLLYVVFTYDHSVILLKNDFIQQSNSRPFSKIKYVFVWDLKNLGIIWNHIVSFNINYDFKMISCSFINSVMFLYNFWNLDARIFWTVFFVFQMFRLCNIESVISSHSGLIFIFFIIVSNSRLVACSKISFSTSYRNGF